MTASRLDRTPTVDPIVALEARQRELYGMLARLRAASAPRERIRELILEIDEHDARVAAAQVAPPPISEYAQLRLASSPRVRAPRPVAADPLDDEPGASPKRILVVGAFVVAAAVLAGIIVSGRGTGSPSVESPLLRAGTRTVPARIPASAPVAAASSVPVRLQAHLVSTPCGSPNTRTALRWTWTLPPGYDGQPATIDATGPGLAGSIRRTVVAGRVRLAYTSACLAPGASWTVSLNSVGATPARLTGVEQIP